MINVGKRAREVAWAWGTVAGFVATLVCVLLGVKLDDFHWPTWVLLSLAFTCFCVGKIMKSVDDRARRESDEMWRRAARGDSDVR